MYVLSLATRAPRLGAGCWSSAAAPGSRVARRGAAAARRSLRGVADRFGAEYDGGAAAVSAERDAARCVLVRVQHRDRVLHRPALGQVHGAGGAALYPVSLRVGPGARTQHHPAYPAGHVRPGQRHIPVDIDALDHRPLAVGQCRVAARAGAVAAQQHGLALGQTGLADEAYATPWSRLGLSGVRQRPAHTPHVASISPAYRAHCHVTGQPPHTARAAFSGASVNASPVKASGDDHGTRPGRPSRRTRSLPGCSAPTQPASRARRATTDTPHSTGKFPDRAAPSHPHSYRVLCQHRSSAASRPSSPSPAQPSEACCGAMHGPITDGWLPRAHRLYGPRAGAAPTAVRLTRAPDASHCLAARGGEQVQGPPDRLRLTVVSGPRPDPWGQVALGRVSELMR